MASRPLTNNGVTDTDGLTITITAVATDHSPSATAWLDQVRQAPGSSGTLQESGSDPSNDSLRYSFSQVSGTNVALSGAGQNRTFTVPSNAGTLVCQLTASDGTTSDTDDVTITVVVVASQPVIGAAPGIYERVNGEYVRVGGSPRAIRSLVPLTPDNNVGNRRRPLSQEVL